MGGKLFVIEGGDGSGKATQTLLLKARLEKQGFKVNIVDFPVHHTAFYGRMVDRYLRGEFGEPSEVNPYLIAILYANDRRALKEYMQRCLEQGNIILANRYTQSNKAFQGAKFKTMEEQDAFFEWNDELEYKEHGIPKPDLVIYLSVPREVGNDWVLKKEKRDYLGTIKMDKHETNLDLQKKAEAVYERLADKEKLWKKIVCFEKGQMLSREAIAEKVWRMVKPYLKPVKQKKLF